MPKWCFVCSFAIAGPEFRGITVDDYMTFDGRETDLRRDSANKYDAFAVSLWCGGEHIGYVPRVCNLVVSGILSSTKLLLKGVVNGKDGKFSCDLFIWTEGK